MKKEIFLLFLVGLVLGCKNFETKKISSQEISSSELHRMNWGGKDLDAYPTFEDCKSITSKEESIQCFGREISKHIFEILSRHEVVLRDSIHEELMLTIKISASGKPSVKKMGIPEQIRVQIPELRTWVEEAITNLPQIYPAEKRGIPVSAEFKLPILISTE